MKTTSRIAYESVKPHLKGVKKQIINGLFKIKKGTFRDIDRASNLRSEQVWKRLSELKREKLITETGVKKCKVSGRLVTIWELKEV